MKPFIQDGHTLVLRAVRKLIATPGSDDAAGRSDGACMVIEEIRTIDWASATFVGKRHLLQLRIEGEASAVQGAMERIGAGLAEADVTGAGQFLADAALERWAITIEPERAVAELRVEALTIEE